MSSSKQEAVNRLKEIIRQDREAVKRAEAQQKTA
jgi:hypothetical protein